MIPLTLKVYRALKIMLTFLNSLRIRMNWSNLSRILLKKCKGLNNVEPFTKFSDKRFENLKKNVNLHLCYLYLMTYDYANVIKTGNGILRNMHPSSKTKYFYILPNIPSNIDSKYCNIWQKHIACRDMEPKRSNASSQKVCLNLTEIPKWGSTIYQMVLKKALQSQLRSSTYWIKAQYTCAVGS
jgi:hypothetical protein